MKIHLAFDPDDALPCVCRVRPILTAFPAATIVIDPAHVGAVFAEKLQRAKVPVEVVQKERTV